MISLTKESSVSGYVNVMHFTFALQTIASSSYDYFVAYFVLGVIYFIIVYALTKVMKLIERRLSKSDKR